jgi:Domain of Unknown Function (DUF748)
MAAFFSAAVERAGRWLVWTRDFLRTRRAQWISFALAIVLILYGLAGFLAGPPILRHVLTTQVAAALNRPVTVGRIQFDPYRLRLEIDKLHVSGRDGDAPFADISHIHVKASWMSLLHLAAVVSQLTIDQPVIHVVRTAPQTFNFSDIFAPAPGAPPPAPVPPSKPFRFAISNIRLRNGDVHFDDQVVGATHNISHIQIGVPFIASLPADLDIYVQPLLAMVVDGSPVRIAGQTKPLSASLETVMNLNLHALDLHRYLSYVPGKLPLAIPRGTLSCRLQVHFVAKRPVPAIAIAGRVALNQVQVNDPAGAPIVGVGHLLVTLNDIEPLAGIFHFGEIRFDGLAPNLVLSADGTTNLTPLMGGAAPAQSDSEPEQAEPKSGAQELPKSAPSAAPSASRTAAVASPSLNASVVASHASPGATASPAAPISSAAAPTATAKPRSGASPLDFKFDSFQIEGSTVRITDNGGETPAILELAKLHLLVKNFTLNGGWAAPFEMTTALASGGQIALKGSVNATDRKATVNAAIDQLDLPALQGFARNAVAAKVEAGKLDAKADVMASFAPGAFDVDVKPANVAIDNLVLATPDGRVKPVKWDKFSVKLAQADLASRSATVSEVRGDGVKLIVRRERGGKLNLLSMLEPPRQERPTAKEAKRKKRAGNVTRAEPRRKEPRAHRRRASRAKHKVEPQPAQAEPWKFEVASVVFDKSEVRVADNAAPRPVELRVLPLNIRLKNVSSDFKKPIPVDIDGTIGRRGAFKITGTAAISPLRAELSVTARRIDVSPADAYISRDVNARIATALLTMNGTARVDDTRAGIRGGFRGDIALDNLRVLDRSTSQDFLRWKSLRVRRIDAAGGAGAPMAHIGEVALTNFDAGIILTADGKLNLQDITSRPGVPAPSPAPGAEATLKTQATPAAAPTAAQESAPAPIPADIQIGGVTLKGGNVNFSDNFIKPNYAANLSEIAGKVGEFGTASSQPAPVELHGEINGSAPMDITGSVNPLAPMAFVDLTVKADGVDLIGFSPYTTKYTGYPIVNGTLTADVHYLLNQGELTADNHIVINQLTFGAKVENSTAINLPIRLAVAILKNPQGVIDLNVPVSGSLSNPNFSITGLVMHAFWNVIVKAATSPLSIIASAFGTSANLSQIDYAPGYAVLTSGARSKLDTLARALNERTNLKLTIQGCVDPSVDRAALPGAKVDLEVREQKLKATGGSGNPWEVKVAPDEYDKYLRRAYYAANFEKPRNFLGLQKSIPPAEMKKLMVENTRVTDADLRALANARAIEVRKYLAAKVDAKRLFVKRPNLNATAPEGGGKPTRAELSVQ